MERCLSVPDQPLDMASYLVGDFIFLGAFLLSFQEYGDRSVSSAQLLLTMVITCSYRNVRQIPSK